jgi:lipopolysaccharide export LptBFGC system permease protein LptF
MKLFLYVLRELVQAFVFAVGGMLVIALPVIAVAAMSRLPGVHMSWVLRFLPLMIAQLVPYVLPLSFLLAVVSTYGRLAADNEWTAIRMAGIHPVRMLLPGLLIAAGLSFGTTRLLEEHMPTIRRAQDGFRAHAIREQFKEFSPGETELKIGPFFLSSAWREGDDFLRAILYVPKMGDDPARTVLAERVRFQVSDREVFVFLHKARFTDAKGDFRTENTTLRVDLDQLLAPKEQTFGSTRHKTSREIAKLAEDPATPEGRANRYRYEVQYRRALSCTYLMFLLLGAPTGLFLRKGTQLGALSAAIGYALLYYLLSMRLSTELTDSRVVPPLVGAWSVIAIGSAVGVYLVWRTVRR